MIICRSLALLIIFSFYSYSVGNEQVAMALTFAADEINRNPDLLPNTSLLYYTEEEGCHTQSKYFNEITLTSVFYTYFYYHCYEMKMCGWVTTGPNWAISASYAKLLSFLLPHMVRFCRIVLQKILFVHAITIYKKNMRRTVTDLLIMRNYLIENNDQRIYCFNFVL